MLDPDGRLAALPADRRDRILADKLELIAASPQADLLKGFCNPETRRGPALDPALGAAAGPRQDTDLQRTATEARAGLRPGRRT